MKIYHFENVNHCYLYGSINGEFDSFIKDVIERLVDKTGYEEKEHPKELERKKRQQNNPRFGEFEIISRPIKLMKSKPLGNRFSDCVIIVNGNTGFGSKNMRYYVDKLEELNPILERNNTYIVFVRGSFDDPEFFESEAISFSQIKTVPDYSVLMLDKFNCLCIGGSVSIDREWKKRQGERLGKKLYWENEPLVYKEDELDEILEKMEIACVITNSSPSFSYPGTNSLNSSSWKVNDKTVLDDIQNERKLVDKIYSKFIEKNKKPYVWVYSSFLLENEQSINDIFFRSLSKLEVFNFNQCVMNNFGISLKDKLTNNLKSFDNLVMGDIKKNIAYRMDDYVGMEYDLEEEANEEEANEEIDGNIPVPVAVDGMYDDMDEQINQMRAAVDGLGINIADIMPRQIGGYVNE